MTGPRTRRRAADRPDAVVELANFPDADPPSQSITEERRERELEDAISEIGTDGKVRVWQIVDGRSSYAGEMSIVDFNLDALLENYGGGDKSLVFYQGRTKKETIRVSLDPSIPPRNPRTARLVTGAPVAANPMAEMMPVFAGMVQMQAQGAQMMQTMMASVMGAMAQMVAARPVEKDPMDTAIRMAELLKRSDAGGSPAAELMGMMKQGMEIGMKMNGEKDDGMTGLIGEGMKTLSVLIDGIVTTQKAKAAMAAREIPASGAVALAPPIPSAEGRASGVPHGATGDTSTHIERSGNANGNEGAVREEGAVSVRPWVDAARPSIGMLLNAARFMPASAAADTIATNMADDAFFDLIDDIRDQTPPGFGPRLVGYFPDAANVKPEWIGELVGELLEHHVSDEGDAAQLEIGEVDTPL